MACLLRRDGVVVGSSSAYAANVELIGGRRFWTYRNLLDDLDLQPAMIRATFDALQAEFNGSPGQPLGLCFLAGPEERRLRPEAEWSHPRMVYAGYVADGRQARIAYFEGALIA